MSVLDKMWGFGRLTDVDDKTKYVIDLVMSMKNDRPHVAQLPIYEILHDAVSGELASGCLLFGNSLKTLITLFLSSGPTSQNKEIFHLITVQWARVLSNIFNSSKPFEGEDAFILVMQGASFGAMIINAGRNDLAQVTNLLRACGRLYEPALVRPWLGPASKINQEMADALMEGYISQTGGATKYVLAKERLQSQRSADAEEIIAKFVEMAKRNPSDFDELEQMRSYFSQLCDIYEGAEKVKEILLDHPELDGGTFNRLFSDS